MKECLSGSSYLYQKHLLYRGTTNNKVTSEQNINNAAVDPHRRQREGKEKSHTRAEEHMEKEMGRRLCFIFMGQQLFVTPWLNHFIQMCFVQGKNGIKWGISNPFSSQLVTFKCFVTAWDAEGTLSKVSPTKSCAHVRPASGGSVHTKITHGWV